MADIIEELSWRGLIADASDKEAIRNLKSGSFYCGFDPTAPALHLGNLIPMLSLYRVSKSGMQALALFGGATGAIGDPSGRSQDRVLLSRDEIDSNISKHQKLFHYIFDKLEFKPEFVNNFDWTHTLSALDFLREIGKHITVNYMLQKESVQTRMHGDGLSFTEFSYMLLQAFDFYHLYQTKGCKLQIGGSDQWGNITAGLELIRKKAHGQAYALGFPLLTDSQGNKLGKSSGGGALWLDPKMCSPFKLHQYFLNIDDRDIIKIGKYLTLLDRKALLELEDSVKNSPEKRDAQHNIADAICTLIHGDSETTLAKRGAQVLFGGSFEGITEDQLSQIFEDVPSTNLAKEEYSKANILDLFVRSGLVTSRGEAKRLVQSGGAYLDNQRVSDITLIPAEQSSGRLRLLRSGKKNYHLIRLTE